MKLGAMQPYLFPYLGYFQLVAAVDHFVILDDVQIIPRGWIHRNRILVDGAPQYVRLPLAPGPSRALISERRFAEPLREHQSALLAELARAYEGAPHYAEAIELVEAALDSGDPRIERSIAHSLRTIARALGIEARISFSSEIDKPPAARGQERILALNEALGADHYVNLTGGVRLYDENAFGDRGIELDFIRMRPVAYDQGTDGFVPALSIIDVLMFAGRAGTRELLTAYDLVPATALSKA